MISKWHIITGCFVDAHSLDGHCRDPAMLDSLKMGFTTLELSSPDLHISAYAQKNFMEWLYHLHWDNTGGLDHGSMEGVAGVGAGVGVGVDGSANPGDIFLPQPSVAPMPSMQSPAFDTGPGPEPRHALSEVDHALMLNTDFKCLAMLEVTQSTVAKQRSIICNKFPPPHVCMCFFPI